MTVSPIPAGTPRLCGIRRGAIIDRGAAAARTAPTAS